MLPKPAFRRPLSPQNSLHTKNATRHESLLNALLCAWIQVRSATPLKFKTVRCAIHKFYSRQEVKNHELHTPH